MDMNSPIGKEILALVRKGDYAHAGEEEAVDLVFKNIPRDPKRLLIDVGCGRGGTANYIQNKGWGRVTGIDIDAESIVYAKKRYPDIEFLASDIIKPEVRLQNRFDIAYLFNSFYAFPDHVGALREIRSLCRARLGQVIIFDYTLKAGSGREFPFEDWNPIDLSVAKTLFDEADFRISKIEDISHLYKIWYNRLVSLIEKNSSLITALAGREWFDYVASFYRGIAGAIARDILGGAIIYAVLAV